MRTEAETEEMQLQAKDHPGQPEAKKRQEGLSPRASAGSKPPPTP